MKNGKNYFVAAFDLGVKDYLLKFIGHRKRPFTVALAFGSTFCQSPQKTEIVCETRL